jgi:hypothetical protein
LRALSQLDGHRRSSDVMCAVGAFRESARALSAIRFTAVRIPRLIWFGKG